MATLTVDEVRLALMDFAARNIPLYVCHLTDEDLSKCMDWAMDYINEAPPKVTSTTYTIEDFKYKNLLLQGSVVEALKMTALIELRGEMQYSDGGTQSSIYYKSAQFTQLRQEAEQNFKNAVSAVKRQINVEGCYGGTW